MQKRISFIIPVYNGKKCIVRCIKSILALSMSEKDFEIIVVDDCSVDDTYKIVADFAKSHQAICVYQLAENSRQGAARNLGIEKAKGEYIQFVDADDKVMSGVVTALEVAENNNLDICLHTLVHNYGKNKSRQVCFPLEKGDVCDGRHFLNSYFYYDVNACYVGVIRTTLLMKENLRFIEKIQWEDGDFCIKMFHTACRIGQVKENGYLYDTWSFTNSTSSSPKNAYAIVAQINMALRMLKFTNNEYQSEEPFYEKTIQEIQWRYFYHNLRLRNLTKISWRENLIMHKNLTKSDWDFVSIYTLSKWEKVVCRHFYMASIVLFFACPIARLGRYLLNAARHNEI